MNKSRVALDAVLRTAMHMSAGMQRQISAGTLPGEAVELAGGTTGAVAELSGYAKRSATLLEARGALHLHRDYPRRVCEEFGAWFAVFLLENNRVPPPEEGSDELDRLASEFFGSGTFDYVQGLPEGWKVFLPNDIVDASRFGWIDPEGESSFELYGTVSEVVQSAVAAAAEWSPSD